MLTVTKKNEFYEWTFFHSEQIADYKKLFDNISI